MRVLIAPFVLLVACTASNPSFNAAISACVAASPSTWQDCERDLSAVPDLAPSCGRFIGDECCFAPPNLLVCDPGMQCGATRRCEAVPMPDMAVIPDLRPVFDLAGCDRCVQPCQQCNRNSDCYFKDNLPFYCYEGHCSLGGAMFCSDGNF